MTGAFTVQASDGRARAGRLQLRRHEIDTPAFMPVGTYGSVKGLTPEDLAAAGSTMVLANACHLHDRPGEDTIAALGGLGAFLHWDGPTLTDSGGFQVFSMLDVARLDEQGVTFRSPLDGRALRLGPDEAVDIQLALDSDVAMVFDHCPPLPADHQLLLTSVRRTTRWARRARERHHRLSQRGQLQFGIVQGGLDDDLRRRSRDELVELDFPGYALGGLSVGEGSAALQAAAQRYAPLLPEHKVRYLMGVGRPADLLAAIAAGVDLFDCVLPTRNGRHGTVFAAEGTIHLKNSRFRTSTEVLDPTCPCRTCSQGWSRGVLRHLIKAGEPLGRSLCALHNLTHLHRLVDRARQAIREGRLAALLAEHGLDEAPAGS